MKSTILTLNMAYTGSALMLGFLKTIFRGTALDVKYEQDYIRTKKFKLQSFFVFFFFNCIILIDEIAMHMFLKYA